MISGAPLERFATVTYVSALIAELNVQSRLNSSILSGATWYKSPVVPPVILLELATIRYLRAVTQVLAKRKVKLCACPIESKMVTGTVKSASPIKIAEVALIPTASGGENPIPADNGVSRLTLDSAARSLRHLSS